MCKVSVIVPVYKVEKYINKCVDSLINQTLRDIEIILVDDGSPDNCGEICEGYARKDSRVKVIHKKNGGLSDARNAGLKLALGEFVGFVDSDDYVSLDMFETLYYACVDNNAEVSGCDLAYVFEEKKDVIQGSSGFTKVMSPDDFYTEMLNIDGFLRVGVWNKLYKKTLFEGIEFPKGKLFEDVGTLYRVILSANKTVYISKPCYMYLKQRIGAITTGGYKEQDLDRHEMTLEMIKYVQYNRPNLYNIAVGFKSVNCNLSIVNLMLHSDTIDPQKIKMFQAENRKNMIPILYSNLRPIKKLQVIIMTYSLPLYKILYKNIRR